ncbi:hypothetical protein D3C74_481670 [compost metagenome]
MNRTDRYCRRFLFGSQLLEPMSAFRTEIRIQCDHIAAYAQPLIFELGYLEAQFINLLLVS